MLLRPLQRLAKSNSQVVAIERTVLTITTGCPTQRIGNVSEIYILSTNTVIWERWTNRSIIT